MPKAKLVTRSATTTSVTADSIPKNSGLTNAELDSNFLNLRDQGWRIRADDSTLHEITADTQVRFDGATITADANGDIVVSDIAGGNTDVNIFTQLQVSPTGATGTSIGSYMRVNSSQIDFNHQGNYGTGETFTVYGSDGQQANGRRPFTINLHGSHEGCMVGLAAFNSQAMPTTYTSGHMVCVQDSNYRPAYYDGSNWRYVHDNSAV